MELYWEVLLIALLNFRFIYPSERHLVPRWLMDELLERLHDQADMKGPGKKVCRGRISQPARLCDRRRSMGLLGRRRQSRRTIWRVATASCASRRSATFTCMEDSVAPYRELFTEISGAADVLVLCGDLTNFGKTSEAEILAEDIRSCTIPVLGVLGNHDYECGQPEKVCRDPARSGDDRARRAGDRDRGRRLCRGQRVHGRLRPRRAGAVRRADRQGVRRRGDERGAQARERASLAAHRAQRRRASLFADRWTRSKASRSRSSNIWAPRGWPTRSTASIM